MAGSVLNFIGREGKEDLPQCAIYLVDAGKRIEKKLASIEDNKINIAGTIEKERNKTVAIGPDAEDLSSIQRENLVEYKIEDFLERMKKGVPFEIPRAIWIRWLIVRVCLSGKVSRCRPFPVLLPCIPPVRPCPPPPFLRCAPVCNGVVEIYERQCCRLPLVVPDIPYIIRKLKELYDERVTIPGKWPPPPPDPEIGITVNPPVEGGADLAIRKNASPLKSRTAQAFYAEFPETLAQDIQSLESLPQAEAILYAQKRPYLWPYWCTCRSRKLGEAILQPDGQFHFCYNLLVGISRRNCWTSYFYKVKQWHENQWVYIYNGVPGHHYFAASQYANLRTFFGRTCMAEPPITPPVDKPWVMLEKIGDTDSYRLKSNWGGSDASDIDQTQVSDTSLKPLIADGGLVDAFSSSAVDSVVTTDPAPWFTNQPWGQNLVLRLCFDEKMKAAGAVYYRFKAVPADATGAPVAGAIPRLLADPVAWLKMIVPGPGATPQVVSESLGPDNSKGEPALFRIPYRADAAWLDYQSHQTWYTTGFQSGRYLLTLELFDKNGKLMDPAADNFLYLRWLKREGTDSTAIVPFKGLVHLFWIDNTPCYADIVDLRKNGVASSEECQYFEGISSTKFSAGFYAYQHTEIPLPGTPDRSFLWYYTLWTHRGLNGPNAAVETAGVNTPLLSSGTPKPSDPLTYGDMLSGLTRHKCAFALNLRARAKHTNGSRRLWEYDAGDQAAFSIEEIPVIPVITGLATPIQPITPKEG